jgi:hypothetical protein
MTGMALFMRTILAVHLIRCIRTRPLIPNSRLTGITHIGQTTQIEARGTPAPRAWQARGNPPW